MKRPLGGDSWPNQVCGQSFEFHYLSGKTVAKTLYGSHHLELCSTEAPHEMTRHWTAMTPSRVPLTAQLKFKADKLTCRPGFSRQRTADRRRGTQQHPCGRTVVFTQAFLSPSLPVSTCFLKKSWPYRFCPYPGCL